MALPCVSSLLPPSTTVINTTDIVPFIECISVQHVTILRYQLKNPVHCNFYLEGYSSMVENNKLSRNIITAAIQNGTSLKIDINDKYNKAKPNK